MYRHLFLKSWITVGERSKTDSLSLTWQLSNHFAGRLSEHDFVEASADCSSTKATSIMITGTAFVLCLCCCITVTLFTL